MICALNVAIQKDAPLIMHVSPLKIRNVPSNKDVNYHKEENAHDLKLQPNMSELSGLFVESKHLSYKLVPFR